MATSVAAHARVARQQSWLVFALGPYVMCASALDVEGIVTHPQAIARVPLAPHYALGAFVFRGSTAAAINLRKKLRLPENEHPETSPFIVSRIADSFVAFSVDEVRDVLEENDLEWRSIPSSLAGGLFDRLAIRDGSLILQTSFAALRDIQVELAPLATWLPPCNEGEIAASGSSLADEAHAAAPGAALLAPKELPRAGLEVKEEAKVEAEIDPREFGSVRPPVSGGLEHETTRNRSASVALSSVVDRRNLPSRSVLAAAAPSKDLPGVEGRSAKLPDPKEATRSDSSKGEETPQPAHKRALRRVALAWICAVAALFAALYLEPFVPSGRATLAPTSAPGLSQHESASASKPPVNEPRVPTTQDLVGPATTDFVPSSRHPEATEQETAVRRTPRTHVVVRGETLWGIAKKEAGDPYRYPELANLSNIANPDLIHPGELVRIR